MITAGADLQVLVATRPVDFRRTDRLRAPPAQWRRGRRPVGRERRRPEHDLARHLGPRAAEVRHDHLRGHQSRVASAAQDSGIGDILVTCPWRITKPMALLGFDSMP